jgi:hypothetical protein
LFGEIDEQAAERLKPVPSGGATVEEMRITVRV